MFDILVNGQLVAVAAEQVTKLFVNALVSSLPLEVSITTKRHEEPQVAEESEPSEAK